MPTATTTTTTTTTTSSIPKTTTTSVPFLEEELGAEYDLDEDYYTDPIYDDNTETEDDDPWFG